MAEFKVSGVIGAFIVLVLSCLVSSQDHPDDLTTNLNRRRTVSDPVSNFLSDLGDLILDADRAFAVMAQPKIEHESNLVSQIFRPTTDYFDRIQKNYRNAQKRLGRFIGNSLGYKDRYSDHELSTVSPPLVTTEEDGIISTTTPISSIKDYNPFAAADEERKRKLKASGTSFHHKCSNEILSDPDLERIRKADCARIAAEQAQSDFKKLMSDSRKISEALLPAGSKALDELSKGLLRSLDEISNVDSDTMLTSAEGKSSSNEKHDKTSSIPTDECSTELLADPSHERLRKKKCARLANEEQARRHLRKITKDSQRATEILIPLSSEAIDQLSKTLIRRSGDVAESESLFNTQVRQLFKDHGKWFLDNPLLSRWRQSSEESADVSTESESSEVVETTSAESLSETTEAATETESPLPTSAESQILSKLSVNEIPLESSYYKIVNDNGEVVEEEVDIVLEPESLSEDIGTEFEEQGPQDTVILAFTSDGVPLKLRMGPEIDNPLRYLHKVLKSAGVSLNIPVESYDDLEPVGKEVLKLGSGILTRAALIDVSNNNELKSLLKALMTGKASGRTNY